MIKTSIIQTCLFKLESCPLRFELKRVNFMNFRYYGLWMWFPEIFERIKQGKSGCGGIVEQQSALGNNNTNFSIVADNRTCLERVAQENEIYFESFLIAISNLPGLLVTYLLIDRLGRRNLLGE